VRRHFTRERTIVFEMLRIESARPATVGLMGLLLLAGCPPQSTTDGGADGTSTDAPVSDGPSGAESGPMDSGSDAGGPDATPPADSACTGVDAPTDVQNMNPPDGAIVACRTTANCMGIGRRCSMSGNECSAEHNYCDLDLSPMGQGICIRIGCAVGHHDCGPGATCCSTPMTQNTPVCLPSNCRPTDCPLEAP
jgi:hypothetical protein